MHNVVMRLQLALLPPPSVQEDVAAFLASMPAGHDQLAAVPPALVHLRVANFGAVALGDAVALRSVLENELSRWPPMTLRFHGGVALEPEGDDSIWASLEGDTEQLIGIGDLVPQVAKPLGFMLDRREFRTQMRIARITMATSASYLQQVVTRLETYTGAPWTCHELALLRMLRSGSNAEAPFDVLHRLPLAAVSAAQQVGDP